MSAAGVRSRCGGAGRAQMDGAPDPGPAVGGLLDVGGRGSPPSALAPLWGAYRAPALREGQSLLHHVLGGRGGALL